MNQKKNIKAEGLDGKNPANLLLDISRHIAQIQNREELFDALLSRIKPVFQFKDNAIFIIDKDRQHYRMWHDTLTEEYTQGKLSKEGAPISLKNNPVADDCLLQPIHIISKQEMLAANPDTSVINWIEQSGTEEVLVCPLKVGNVFIGWINCHASKTNVFASAHFDFYQAVADLLAVAISNILANEEILEREREKILLLSLSEDMATIRNRNDLWRVMMHKLKPVIGFDDAVVICYPEDKKTSKTILTISEGDRSHQDWYKYIFNKSIPTTPPLQYIFNLGTSYWSTQAILDKFPGFEGCNFMLSQGLTDTYQVVMKHGGLEIGIVLFHFSNNEVIPESKYDLCKSIADQISVAIANILSNEEIIEREKTKTLQIAAINSITGSKDKQTAFYNLATVIHEVVPFLTFSIASPFDIDYLVGFQKDDQHQIIPWDNVTEICTLANISREEYQRLIFELVESGFYSKSFICNGDDHKALCAQFKIAALHHQFKGIQSALYIPVLINRQTVSIHFYFTSKEENGFTVDQLNLLTTVMPSITLAIENLFAFEDIEKQEKEKSVLLNLANSIANIQDKQMLWDMLVTQLQSFFDIERDYTFLYLLTPDKAHYYFFLLNDNAILNEKLIFKNLIDNKFPVRGNPYEKAVTKTVWIIDIEKEQENYPNFWGFKESLKFGANYTAIIRLQYGGDVIGTLHLNSSKKDAFHPAQIPFMEAIGKQVSIAISNIIARNKIANQLIEITKLKKQLEAENEYLQEAVDVVYNFDQIIGSTPEMQQIYKMIAQIAETDSTVLILGETGTGKELIARAIHNASSRKDRLLVKINCAALPANLIESELFGHERGSFTGAVERRIGKFELANHGTLFLDEIGELPLDLQSKLLRAIQEKEVERLGSNKVIKIDVRIIAATNRDLYAEVLANRFRSDLYYRLNIFPILLPPLRARKEDIPLLANHFIQKYSKKIGKEINGLSNKALSELMKFDWPGNIREFEYMIERAVIFCKTKTIYELQWMNAPIRQTHKKSDELVLKSYADNERSYILSVLRYCKGKIHGPDGAASILKLPASTLQSKMKKLGITKRHVLVE
ncbi:MAG: sigma 54-interacting transcriptional regulator [Bacteroidota bacterium]